jgi:hypothetical protein
LGVSEQSVVKSGGPFVLDPPAKMGRTLVKPAETHHGKCDCIVMAGAAFGSGTNP